MNLTDRYERLNRMIDTGSIIRGAWTEGQHRACLLAALAPECGEAKSSSACPAELMPEWLAELTPWLDDSGSDEAWPGLIRRYARCAPHFHMLTDRTLWRVLAAIVREAMMYADDARVLSVCERVASLYEAAVESGLLETAELAEAAIEARAAEAATRAAAAEAAAWAAEAWAAALMVAWATMAAARASESVARAAVDRLQDQIMTILEQDCGVAS